MRVAYVVSDLSYPPREGLHQQSLQTIEALREIGMSVDVYGYLKPRTVQADATAAALFSTPPILNSTPTLILGVRNALLPIRLLSRADQAMMRSVRSGGYDIIHLEAAAACGLARGLHRGQTVMSLVDPQSRRYWRFSMHRKGLWKLAALAIASLAYVFEALLSRRGAVFHVVSVEDEHHLGQRSLPIETVCIPVSLPRTDHVRRLEPGSRLGRPLRVVVFADLRQVHMRDATEAFLSHVAAKIQVSGAFEIEVLGRTDPGGSLSEKAEVLGINIRTWVEDISAYLAAADIVVLPDTMGTGIKNRAIQAMALGRVTIGTRVAFEGIPIKQSHEAIIYDDAQQAIQALTALAASPDRMAEVGVRGQRFAAARYGVDAIAARWRNLYYQLSSTDRK